MKAIALVLLFALSLRAEVFDVRQSGAVGDGKTVDTAAIQKALDACTNAGGGASIRILEMGNIRPAIGRQSAEISRET